MATQYDVSGTTQNVSPSFNEAGNEGQWSIVFGEKAISLNLYNKGIVNDTFKPVADNFLDRAIGFTNHNYIEIQDPDGNVVRRTHAQEVKMTLGEGNSRTMIGSYGSKELGFDTDQIYYDDPHPTIPNMLEDGDDPKETKTVLSGTKEQILTTYHQILSTVIHLNNEDPDYDALTQNGNAIAAELVEQIVKSASQQKLHIQEMPDSGGLLWNNNVGYDPDIYYTPDPQALCFSNTEELVTAIHGLEDVVASQVNAIQLDSSADINTPITEQDKLECQVSSSSQVKMMP